MTSDLTPPSTTPEQTPISPLTWIAVLSLLAFSLLVTLGVHGVTLGLAWFGDLQKMPASAQTYLAYGLLHPLLVGLASLPLLLFRQRRPGVIVRTALLTTLAVALLLLPRALLSPLALLSAGLLRAGIAGLLGGGLLLWGRRSQRVQLRPATGFGLMAVIGVLYLIPWLLDGALGDVLDIAVALLQALALAFLAAGLAAFLMSGLQDTSARQGKNMWLGGFTLAVCFTALGAAWGQMGYQALLALTLPGLGFPLALLGLKQKRYDLLSAVLVGGLIATGPLAFSDAREVRLIGMLSGETAAWAMRAGGIDFLLGWIIALLLGGFKRKLLCARVGLSWTKWAGIVGVAAGILYATAGQPGLFGDAFFVVMKEQADLSPAFAIEDVTERRAWVYETLVSKANDSQPDLLAWLSDRNLPYRRFYLVNGVEVRAHALRRWQISQRDDVARIVDSPHLRPLPRSPEPEPGQEAMPETPAWGVEAIGAPRVWSELGVTGEGVVVGHADSGVDAAHPALAANYRGREEGHDYQWLDVWFGKPEPYDLNGHGTHTLAIAVGQGGVGVAPGATWFSCANLVREFGNPAVYLECMQFMLAPYPFQGDPLADGRPDLAADVNTNSWGCPPAIEGCDQLTLWQAAEALRAAGIFFVAAAGNAGPACDSLQDPPGNYDNVFTVGAIDRSGEIADFSSRGPHTASPDGNTGPELLAPGVDIPSAWPGASWNTLSGTSMAAPHVAGVVALMWSANPTLRGDIDTTRQILIETAMPYKRADDGCGGVGEWPDAAAGYGVVDAYAAVRRALEMQ